MIRRRIMSRRPRASAVSRVWILGASDPEMEAIDALLRECGERVEYAMVDGRRVRPAEAYSCAPICVQSNDITVYRIECRPTVLEPLYDDHWLGPVVDIDHHRPGDPGYGRPPAEFLESSSIGQVIHYLCRIGVDMPHWDAWSPRSSPARRNIPEPGLRRHSFYTMDLVVACVAGGGTRDVSHGTVLSPDEQGTRLAVETRQRPRVMRHVPQGVVLAAAADHCLGAAYRGECPGVDPDELMRWRVASRAAFQGRDESEVLADVERARAELRTALRFDVHTHTEDHVWLADMRRETPIPELPEAATREGIGYMSGPLVGPDGRRKFTCSGTAEQVRAWLEWAEREGLVDLYGDPARGFAGGYEVTS